MTTAEQYLENAQRCEILAMLEADQTVKSALREAARRWRERKQILERSQSADYCSRPLQFPRQNIIASPAERLKARSGLVRRLVQARDDPAKQRIRAWLKDLDDVKLSGLGLAHEDIVILRGVPVEVRRNASSPS
jgi:hypothetical protein